MRRKIIIDTDPGQDDAIALLCAAGAFEELNILGVTTVAGNAELADTTQNALKIRELIGTPERSLIPIYRGSGAPLARRLITCQGFHGPDGLGGANLPEPKLSIERESATDFLIGALEAASIGEITICTLGPQTNVARALRKQPLIASRIAQLVMMGGAHLEHGNVTPAAEFNMSVDPEAAKVVLDTLSEHRIPITMIPLDVTHRAQPNRNHIEGFRKLSNRSGKVVADILSARGYKPAYYEWTASPLHDPCVIAYLLRPELFSGRLVNVEIETEGQWTAGMTVVDWLGVSGRTPNVHFMTDIDSDGYHRLLLDYIERLP